MQGYYKDTEATKKTIKGEWLFTGDLGKVDRAGYYYIVDRKKDMIVSGGEIIYPREIEEVLFRHPEVADAAEVGIPHATWGETVRAHVVLKRRKSADENSIIEFCKSHLTNYKKPTSVVFTDAIPTNSAGKALKRLLRSDIH